MEGASPVLSGQDKASLEVLAAELAPARFVVADLSRQEETFVREEGMWAETGVNPHPLAGQVTPDEVAAAVVKAIKENRAEIDVAPLSARLAVTAPRLVGVGRTPRRNRIPTGGSRTAARQALTSGPKN